MKKRWEVGGDDEGAESAKERPLSQEEKDAVKGSILDLMCSVPSDVQKQLSEALTIISEHDFPGACRWAAFSCHKVYTLSMQLAPVDKTIDSHIFCLIRAPTEKWQNLLGDMVGKFASRDLHIINGVLRSANAILKRFRCVGRTCDTMHACM